MNNTKTKSQKSSKVEATQEAVQGRTREVFETFVNAQTQLMTNFVEAAKKVQKTVEGTDAAQKANELYKDWSEKQKSIVDSMVDTAKGQLKLDDAPDFLKEWVESQEKFAKNVYEYMRSSSDKVANTDFIELYKVNMNKVYDNFESMYNHMTEQFGKPFSEMKFIPEDAVKKMVEMWKPIYSLN